MISLPSSITRLLNEVQSGKIGKSEALKRAVKIQLSNGELHTSGSYLEQMSQQKPLPQMAIILADIFLITADTIKDESLKGMFMGVCADVFRENYQTIPKAIEIYKKTLKIFSDIGNRQLIATAQNNLGLAYLNLPTGDLSENLKNAITCYQQALETFTKVDFPVSYSAAQNNIGNAYMDLPTGDRCENIENAITCYQQALETCNKADFPVQYATTLNNLGTAYMDLPMGNKKKNLKNAITYYQQALDIFTKADFPADYAMTRNNLGLAYSSLPTGDIKKYMEKAITCYQQGLEICTKADFPVRYATIQYNLGNAYSNLPTADRGENFKKAITCYQQALEIYTKADFPIEYANAQDDLGTAYFNLPTGNRGENLKKAITCYQQAMEIREQQKLWENILRTRKNFIRLYFVEKEWERVIDLSQEAIGIYNEYWELIFLSQSKKNLSNLVFEIFRMLSYAFFKKGQFIEAVMSLDEGSSRLLSETMTIGQELPENIPEPIKKKALLLYQEIQVLQPKPGKANQLETYKEKLQEFKELMKPHRPKGTNTFRDLFSLLKQEKVALLYLNVTSHGGFYALIHDTASGEKDMFPLAKISNDAVKEFYWNEKDGWFTLYNQDRLYKLGKLFEHAEDKIHDFANQSELNKILQRIEELEIKKLVFFPQGNLHTFPFGGIKAIPKDLEICFSPNVQMLLHSYNNNCATDRDNMSFTAFANPCEDVRLFFTNAEVTYISSLMHHNRNRNVKIHWGRTGDKQTVFDDSKESSLLHFSTHGYHDPEDVENSCLFLFKDQLSLKDINQLSLSSCFMLVMSACETGIPDLNSPGEYTSLSAGFHQVGTKTVVSALWPVFDLSTSLLMGEFYRCFLKDSVSPAYAMRQAQKWLKESHPNVIIDRLKEYRAILKVEKKKLSSLEEPWIDFQINIIRGSLIAIESQINRLKETNTPPFQNPYYWAGFIVNGWGF